MKTETLVYTHAGVNCAGYAVYEPSQKRPGVAIFSDFRGLTDYAKQRAGRVAELGYNVLLADMYGVDARGETHAELMALMAPFNNDRDLTRARAGAALDALAKLSGTDASRLAGVGYCFGGMVVLELARSNAPVRGVVSLHGVFDTPTPATSIAPKVLILHGDEDFLVPEPTIRALEKEMREAKANWEFVNYGATSHGFTNSTLPEFVPGTRSTGYSPQAERRSWIAMQNFLSEIFA